jgi:hypothetical protein
MGRCGRLQLAWSKHETDELVPSVPCTQYYLKLLYRRNLRRIEEWPVASGQRKSADVDGKNQTEKTPTPLDTKSHL